MRFRGLPSFDAGSQSLRHPKFTIPIQNIAGFERVSVFGLAWGLKLHELDGTSRVCIVTLRGSKKHNAELALECTLISVMEAAYAYWTAAFERQLELSGEFFHAGIRVTVRGDVSGSGVSGSLAHGKFSHEVDGETLRLRFVQNAKVGLVDLKPGLARDAVISVLYELRDRCRKIVRPGVNVGADLLRQKAKARNDVVIRDLATVLSRHDVMSGRAKLQAFLASNGLPPAIEDFFPTALKLLVQKPFIQKSFEDIQRYHERTMQPLRPAELFEQFIRLAEHEGRISAKQMFALYEIGLYLAYSMPRITAMISAILTGGDPAKAAEEAERRERERRSERASRDYGGDGRLGDHDPFEEFEADSRLPVPSALLPMMTLLGLAALDDERTLRAAWTSRMRQFHPDTLPPDATPEAREVANQMTVECNMAYELLLQHLRSKT